MCVRVRARLGISKLHRVFESEHEVPPYYSSSSNLLDDGRALGTKFKLADAGLFTAVDMKFGGMSRPPHPIINISMTNHHLESQRPRTAFHQRTQIDDRYKHPAARISTINNSDS